MEQEKIKSIIESLLFVSGDPIKISKISKLVGVSHDEMEQAITSLVQERNNNPSGLMIVRKEDDLQMITNPENASFIEQLLRAEAQGPLSGAAVEVLSIIAYKGPISRVEIDAIRGVNCAYTLRTLLMRGLVDKVENPNDSRSYLYKISFDFLKNLGIDSVQKLPNYEELTKDERIDDLIKVENNSVVDGTKEDFSSENQTNLSTENSLINKGDDKLAVDSLGSLSNNEEVKE